MAQIIEFLSFTAVILAAVHWVEPVFSSSLKDTTSDRFLLCFIFIHQGVYVLHVHLVSLLQVVVITDVICIGQYRLIVIIIVLCL